MLEKSKDGGLRKGARVIRVTAKSLNSIRIFNIPTPWGTLPAFELLNATPLPRAKVRSNATMLCAISECSRV